MDSYIRTDLASESREGILADAGELQGVSLSQRSEGSVTVSHICICDENAEKILQKPKGDYITLSFSPIAQMDQEQRRHLSDLISKEILGLLSALVPHAGRGFVAGLGNRRITADALGPWTVDRITVTNHLQTLDPTLFSALGQRSVAALAPGVLGDTGVEAAKLIAKAVEAVSPDAVIVVDALAARSVERLGRTVQISNAGISPGSGVGNRRMALNQETLGVPVIAVGVPTVVHSATLVRDALSKAGIEQVYPELETVLQNGEGFFVTSKDCDEMLKDFSQILAMSLDTALALDAV